MRALLERSCRVLHLAAAMVTAKSRYFASILMPQQLGACSSTAFILRWRKMQMATRLFTYRYIILSTSPSISSTCIFIWEIPIFTLSVGRPLIVLVLLPHHQVPANFMTDPTRPYQFCPTPSNGATFLRIDTGNFLGLLHSLGLFSEA